MKYSFITSFIFLIVGISSAQQTKLNLFSLKSDFIKDEYKAERIQIASDSSQFLIYFDESDYIYLFDINGHLQQKIMCPFRNIREMSFNYEGDLICLNTTETLLYRYQLTKNDWDSVQYETPKQWYIAKDQKLSEFMEAHPFVPMTYFDTTDINVKFGLGSRFPFILNLLIDNQGEICTFCDGVFTILSGDEGELNIGPQPDQNIYLSKTIKNRNQVLYFDHNSATVYCIEKKYLVKENLKTNQIQRLEEYQNTFSYDLYPWKSGFFEIINSLKGIYINFYHPN